MFFTQTLPDALDRVLASEKSVYIDIPEFCKENKVKRPDFNYTVLPLYSGKVLIFNSEERLQVESYIDKKNKTSKTRLTAPEANMLYVLTHKDFKRLHREFPLSIRLKSAGWFKENTIWYKDIL